MAYSGTITPSAAWTTVPTPINGDGMDGTDETACKQALANRDQLLYESLIPTTIVQPFLGHVGTGWALSTLSPLYFNSTATTANQYVHLPLTNLVHGASMTAVAVAFDASGSYSGTPAVVNNFLVSRVALATSVALTIGDVNDTATYGGSPDMTDYRVVSCTLYSPETIDLTQYRYHVTIEHESGANAQTGVQVYGARVTLTRPT